MNFIFILNCYWCHPILVLGMKKDWNSIISVRFHVMLIIPVTFPFVSSCSHTVTPSSVYWLSRNSAFSLFPKQKLPAATRGSQPGAWRHRHTAHRRCLQPDRGQIHPSVTVWASAHLPFSGDEDVRCQRQNSGFTVSSDFLCWRSLLFFPPDLFVDDKICFAFKNLFSISRPVIKKECIFWVIWRVLIFFSPHIPHAWK